ncbi:hypothetical protein PtrM4_085480 [Pyrenophora tritici-repentis]|uniref:DUF6590 domain-containing protein n=1 Tax=Pyrenophora tritici-repentis TaxID=45151 RepID=A0A834S0M1_9PLEO|nr:hypothetical protein PtrM4_085480 [Pyrenophora tritici-repentis]
MTNYKRDDITTIRFGEMVHAQIRRFIVVQQKREFCYALPIFTYNKQGTKKPGVVPSEHAIAYSYGYEPILLPGEARLEKDPICIVSNDSEPLSTASRIYFGIHHPIQYNVKVKDLGYVVPVDLSKLHNYWIKEGPLYELEVTGQDGYSATATGIFTQTQNSAWTHQENENVSSNNYFEPVKNPRAFFKKGRVFESSQWGSQLSAVVKPTPTHAVCLPIFQKGYAYPSREHADIVFTTEAYTQQEVNDQSPNRAIYVKKENDNVPIQSDMCMDFAKPYTMEYDIQVCNIGRVFGDSVGYMEKRFAESLGLARSE